MAHQITSRSGAVTFWEIEFRTICCSATEIFRFGPDNLLFEIVSFSVLVRLNVKKLKVIKCQCFNLSVMAADFIASHGIVVIVVLFLVEDADSTS